MDNIIPIFFYSYCGFMLWVSCSSEVNGPAQQHIHIHSYMSPKVWALNKYCIPNFEVHFAQYEKYTHTHTHTHTLNGGKTVAKTWFWQKRLRSSPKFDDCVWRLAYTRKTRIDFKDFNVKESKKNWCSMILIDILFDECDSFQSASQIGHVFAI